MLLSKCEICGSEKSRFIKDQETKGILNKLGLKSPLNKIPLSISSWYFVLNTIPLNDLIVIMIIL